MMSYVNRKMGFQMYAQIVKKIKQTIINRDYIMQIKLSESPVRNRYPLTVSPTSKSQMESNLKTYRHPTQNSNPSIGRGKYINQLSAKIIVMQQKIKDRSDYVSSNHLRNSEKMSNKTRKNSTSRLDLLSNGLKSLKKEQHRNFFHDSSEIRLFSDLEKDSFPKKQQQLSKNGFIQLFQKHTNNQSLIKKSQFKDEYKRNAYKSSLQIPLIKGLNRQNEPNLTSVFFSSNLTREELKFYNQANKDLLSPKIANKSAIESKFSKKLEVIKNDKIANSINKSLSVIQMMKNMQDQKKVKKSQDITEKHNCKQFELGMILGKGKFGQVYLGKHISTGCIVALKKVMKNKLLEYNIVDQFIKEQRLHNAMNHPNIVKFYGFFEQKESFYMTLEYMNGGTLFDYLNIVGKLKIKEAVEFLKDIIEALVYMHQRSIAHRDLKPQNIVISTEGVAKLCDFGWAAVIQSRRKTYCGTLDYASPQILQRKSYDISVDIWSIGVLTYEMLMGRAPFQDKDRAVVRQRIVNSDSFELIYSENVPQQAKQFIEWLIQRDPQKRPKITELLQHRMFTVYSTKTNKKPL